MIEAKDDFLCYGDIVSKTKFNLEAGNYRIFNEIVPIAKHIFVADNFFSPNSSDWAVSPFASLGADNINNALRTRRFDDTNNEGIGFILDVPINATAVTFKITHRRQGTNAAQNVVLQLYEREIPDNAAITTWSSAINLGTFNLPNNLNWQRDTVTLSLATLNLIAGSLHQIEIIRNASSATDNLIGDWSLLSLVIEFI